MLPYRYVSCKQVFCVNRLVTKAIFLILQKRSGAPGLFWFIGHKDIGEHYQNVSCFVLLWSRKRANYSHKPLVKTGTKLCHFYNFYTLIDAFAIWQAILQRFITHNFEDCWSFMKTKTESCLISVDLSRKC